MRISKWAPVTSGQPLAQRFAKVAVGFVRRPLLVVVCALILSLVCWPLMRLWAVQRFVSFTMEAEDAGSRWSLNWTRAADGRENGVWLDILRAPPGGEPLEVIPSGSAREGEAYELWLHSLRDPGGNELLALNQLRADSPGVSMRGEWLARPETPGLVYVGSAPGYLRVAVPSSGLTATLIQTPRGGPARLRFAGREHAIDTFASAHEPMQVALRREQPVAGVPLAVEVALPTYAISRLKLTWHDSPEAAVSLRDPRVQTRVFGITSRTTQPGLSMEVDGTATLSPDRDKWRLQTRAARGAVRLNLDTSPHGLTEALGIGLCFACLCTTWLLAILLASALAAAPSLRSLFVASLVAVIVVHAWMLTWAPMIFTSDSMYFAHLADRTLLEGNLDHIPPARVPGYPLLLAPLITWFNDYGRALCVAQSALAVASALLAYVVARPFMPAGFAALAMLLVGIHPLALVYSRLALSESLASFCTMLLAAVFIHLALSFSNAAAGEPRPARRLLIRGALLGLLCGLSAYVRGNFQLLAPLLAVAVLVCGWRPGLRLRAAGTALLMAAVAVIVMLPWAWRNQGLHGQFALSIGPNYLRFAESATNGLIDENQTAVFEYDAWRETRDKAEGERGVPLDPLLDAVYRAAGIEPSRDVPSPTSREALLGPLVDESVARRPGATLHRIGVAFVTQIGLWNRFDSRAAGANADLSAILRGVQDGANGTNFFIDLATWAWEPRIVDLGRRARHDVSHLRTSPHAAFFRDWFAGGEMLAPLVALLFMLGFLRAIWIGCYPLAGVGLLILANAAALAILAGSDYERYSVPFEGLKLVLAVFTLCWLARAETHSGEQLSGLQEQSGASPFPVPSFNLGSRC